MKMPRSDCVAGNVQFVQELAEVDGPFEAPININFRDLTKLELPPLMWNRSDSCPKKMKITNTGHTVIVSAKWKCERPYLTGGPLVGKYVFSQIHFHWGQTDCRGSEHQICGEQFPLEMHVAHFKTDYVTQESALREKDGMVVLVYLFKLQEEPNHSFKKIINSLPGVRQPSTSYAIDPRPIVSLCHPFTEDYFMYWGSVVTSTCAHILLWIICREPFGISKEQVSEFRKIMDSSQHPISKNNRDIQPLHKRNVFHVNASKHLDNPLLPIKKRLGCYCKESREVLLQGKQRGVIARKAERCYCKAKSTLEKIVIVKALFKIKRMLKVECRLPERINFEGTQTGHSCFVNQTFVVQTARVGSVSIVLKRSGSDPVKNRSSIGKLKKVKSEIYNKQVQIVSKSCCFFPPIETKKTDNSDEKRKVPEKSKLFHSVKAFSQVIHSLEVLKNQTFKKLKKIESINQEIKDMKPFCQDKEDKRWIRKIEKVIMREKRFTIKSSQECLSELKKLAKNCKFDDCFDSKRFPAGANKRKMEYPNDNIRATPELPYESFYEDEGIHGTENQSSKHSDFGKTTDFSSGAQKLIQSFFEDIKDTDDLEETVTKDPNFKKIKSLCSFAGDSKSVSAKNKGYITQKMFNLGNLGDRFFTEITAEDMNYDENWMYDMQNEKLTTQQDVNETKSTLDRSESEKLSETNTNSKPENKGIIPLQRVNTPTFLKTAKEEENGASEILIQEETYLKKEENQTLSLKKTSKKIHLEKSFSDNEEKFYEVTVETVTSTNEANVFPCRREISSLDFSTESTDTQKTLKYKKNMRKSSVVFKISSKKLNSETSLRRFVNIPVQKKNVKNKEKKNHKDENVRYKSLYGLSSNKLTQERIAKINVKLEAEITTISSKESLVENALLSPARRNLTARLPKEDILNKISENVYLPTMKTRTPILDSSAKDLKIDNSKLKQENQKNRENKQIPLKETFSVDQQSITFESTENESRTYTNNTYKASSVDSKTRGLKEFEDKQSHNWFKAVTLKRETPRFLERKSSLVTNFRSLTNISTKPKADFTQRLQLESIDGRKKTNLDAFTKTLKEGYKIIKELPLEASNETHKNLNEEKERIDVIKDIEIQERDSKSQNTFDYDFSTETSSQMNDEFLPKVQVKSEKEKNTTRKRRIAKKKQFLEKENDEPFKILRLADSDKSLARNSLKENENFLALDNKSFQSSVSCSTIKKNSISRPHSAETLHSLKKTKKRKNKKRPHCSKRNSRHYIRKNYSVFKKPSKPFNFLNLTDEEQLKIISVNVAKYIKQKLLDEKNQPETQENTFTTVEKELQKFSDPEKKPEEKLPQESSNLNPQKPKKFRIPVRKPREIVKEKENDLKSIKKPNAEKSQIESIKPKIELHPPQKPVNNFIKLNKQMAGTYRRTTTTNTAPKKVEPKERVKSNLGTKPTNKIPKPKMKTQKKTKEKLPNEKPTEPSHDCQTLLPPIIQTPLSKEIIQKEKKNKSLVTSKKSNSNPRTTNKVQASSEKVEKPHKDVEVKSKQYRERPFSPSKIPKEITRQKKCLVPTCILESNSEAPEKTENLNEKSSQCEVIKHDVDENAEIKTEALFKKELEYFITMQMYLNSGLSTDIETPLHCFNSNILGSGNSIGEGLFDINSIQNFEFSDKDVVVVKENLEESSSSCSQLTEPPAEKDSADEKDNDSLKNKKIISVKIPQVLDECGRINSIPMREGSEDSPSDSSYDCKISITLNTVLNAKETETENYSQGYEPYCLKDNSNSQTTTSLEESSSHITDIKPEITKKESEMSLKMKEKLIEILEGEIKRELGFGDSSGNSSEGLALKARDSEGNLRSQSTGSSSDNIEELARLSNTMKQYLTYLREMKELPNESKDSIREF